MEPLASARRPSDRYLREDRVDLLFQEYLDVNSDERVTRESLGAHGFDEEIIADVFAAAGVRPELGLDREHVLHRLRAAHEREQLRALLGAQSERLEVRAVAREQRGQIDARPHERSEREGAEASRREPRDGVEQRRVHHAHTKALATRHLNCHEK